MLRGNSSTVLRAGPVSKLTTTFSYCCYLAFPNLAFFSFTCGGINNEKKQKNHTQISVKYRAEIQYGAEISCRLKLVVIKTAGCINNGFNIYNLIFSLVKLDNSRELK